MLNLEVDNKIMLMELNSDAGKYSALWNGFVESDANNGALFHNLDFLAYHGKRFKDNENHLLFFKKDELIAVLPLGIFDENGQKMAKSPFGGSFGGFVIQKRLSLSHVQHIVQKTVEYLRERQVQEFHITCAPFIYAERFNEYIDFCLIGQGAELDVSDLTSYIPVSEDAINIFESHAQRATRRSLKSDLKFVPDGNIEEFYRILLKDMEKFPALPTHSLDELQWLKKKFPEKIKAFLVYYQDQPIAGNLIFFVHKNACHMFYWAQQDEYKSLRPTNFLTYHVSKYLYGRGVSYLDFGPQTKNGEIFEGVTNFKEGFGGQGLLRRKYVIRLA